MNRGSCAADFKDAVAELLDFIETETGDGLELGERLGAGEDDAAQGGGGEDEEEGKAEFLGFGFAPFSEALVEDLLLGGEGVGGFDGDGAGAGKGLV